MLKFLKVAKSGEFLGQVRVSVLVGGLIPWCHCIMLCYYVMLRCHVILCSFCVIVVLMWYPVARANRRAGPANGSTRKKCAMRSMRIIISLGFGWGFVMYRRAGVVRSVGFVL